MNTFIAPVPSITLSFIMDLTWKKLHERFNHTVADRRAADCRTVGVPDVQENRGETAMLLYDIIHQQNYYTQTRRTERTSA